MPFYSYRCDCGVTRNELRRIDERNQLPRCACGKRMERWWEPGTCVNPGWNPEWEFPNLDERPGVDVSRFATREAYEKRLKDLHTAEVSLTIREI